MFDAALYLRGLIVLLLAALAVWLVSVVKRDASIVDSAWGGFFLLAALAYAWPLAALDARGQLVLVLVVAWALRLTIYVTWRNWGEDEDHRYREIRRRNEPHFALKSAYLVFGLQAVLASVISLPLLAALRGGAPLGALDALGATLAVFGLVFETAADWQLARFKADAGNRGRVLSHGLWRNSRHPNYFGECCFWWGMFCLGLAAGGWWSLASPLLMTWLLLRVSGVALLERSIGERRPEYADYVRSTSAFIPWPRRRRTLAGVVVTAALAQGCSAPPPMPTAQQVDLDRFMGRWYVIANIPTFLERGAHNAVESYERDPDGSIATTFPFRRDAFDGELIEYRPRGFVSERSNAVWGMQFLWPFKAEYRIAYLSADYSHTIIARNKRDYVWIMARTPQIEPADLADLTRMVGDLGYDVAKLELVPQRW